MAFTLPTFNLACDIYTGPWATKVLRISGVMGNLTWGRRSNDFPFGFGPVDQEALVPGMIILLPALTDVRSYVTSGATDYMEIPAASGRWYAVAAVDDIGKGFDNEHRAAWLFQASQYASSSLYPGLFWPVPMP